VRYALAIAPHTPACFSPQRLLLTVDAEHIADVEYRPEAGGAALVQRLAAHTPAHAVDQLGRVCPSCGTAHALALCLAFESLGSLEAPPRATVARCILAELERAASHLATLSACFAGIGLAPVAATLAELHSGVREALVTVASADPPATILAPGGLAHDLVDPQRLVERIPPLRRRLFQLADRLIDRRRLVLRTVEIGVITQTAAEQFGLRGPLARSAGFTADVRIDRPYAAYATFAPEVVRQEGGDVYARLVVLLLEALEALKLVEQALADLPDGPWATPLADTVPAGEAIGSVEAPRGAFHCRVASDGRKAQVTALEPAPQLSRLLARTLLSRAELDDAALIVLSTDPCSGCLAVASDEFGR
jgi:Ni,Fe-hydrogenase III large subunit